MSVPKRRPVSSWPASLLPAMTLIALLAGGTVSTASSDSTQVVEMTVTDRR